MVNAIASSYDHDPNKIISANQRIRKRTKVRTLGSVRRIIVDITNRQIIIISPEDCYREIDFISPKGS